MRALDAAAHYTSRHPIAFASKNPRMAQTIHLDVLATMRIASPCSASWDDMQGDAKKRHCAQCDLDVHNLAEMTRDEIEEILGRRTTNADGTTSRLCCRLYRRADGTVLTRDCPVGLAAVRAKFRRSATRAFALASLLLSASVLWAQGKRDPWEQGKLVTYQPFKWAYDRFGPPPPVQMMGDFVGTAPVPLTTSASNGSPTP